MWNRVARLQRAFYEFRARLWRNKWLSLLAVLLAIVEESVKHRFYGLVNDQFDMNFHYLRDAFAEMWTFVSGGFLGVTATVVILVLLGLFFHAYLTSASPPPQFSSAHLYLARVGIGFQHLADERRIEVAVTIFNAAQLNVILGTITGHIDYLGERRGEDFDPWIPLALPTINSAPGEILGLHEFMLILDQRIPANIQDRMLLQLAGGETIDLRLSNLNLQICVTANPSLTERVMLGERITARRMNDIVVGRFMTLIAGDRLGLTSGANSGTV